MTPALVLVAAALALAACNKEEGKRSGESAAKAGDPLAPERKTLEAIVAKACACQDAPCGAAAYSEAQAIVEKLGYPDELDAPVSEIVKCLERPETKLANEEQCTVALAVLAKLAEADWYAKPPSDADFMRHCTSAVSVKLALDCSASASDVDGLTKCLGMGAP